MWDVTTEDVLNRWVDGEAPYADDTLLLTLLEDAKSLINDDFTDLDTRITTETHLVSKLKIVIAKMIQRAYKADYSGFSSQSNTDGPFGSSISKAASTKQGLFLDSDDRNLLSPKGSRGGIQVISINPSRSRYDDYCW